MVAQRLKKMRTALHRTALAGGRRNYLRKVWGMHIGEGSRISLKAKLDFTNPGGVHIGDYTIVTPMVQIFTHDFVRAKHLDTYIGSYCFIGAGSIILPGVRIGDHCIVGAGSVVNSDVPDRSIVVGNPAKVVKSNIKTGQFGMLVGRTVR
ncbi:acyltransferase [Erythrobacter litoralis]|uniref:acyltransferase n=1 Tax=Erythrobacter litoralis TaxID=39960 RepID=UPI002434885D|nr:acyltransferase [Erythrobacter litoralis]MDG6079083.1 acyltransferase [Erythrobacter litoralis]